MRTAATLILVGILAAVVAMVASKHFDSPSRSVSAPSSPVGDSVAAPATPGTEVSTSSETVRALKNAKAAMREKRWDDALQALQPAITDRDKTPYLAAKTDEFLGFLLFRTNRYEEAITALERVVRSEQLPVADRQRYKKSLAQLAYKTRDFRGAMSWAEEALLTSPKDEDLLVIAAQVAFQAQDYQPAMERATDLLNLHEASGRAPDEDHIHLLASALEKMGNSTGTFEALQKWCPRLERPRENGICIQMGIQTERQLEAGRRGSIPVDQ